MPPIEPVTPPAGAQAGTNPEGAPESGASAGESGEQSRSAAWRAAEQHKKEAADYKKRLEAYEAKEKQAADAEALKKGEYEKLSAQEKARADKAEAKANEAIKRAALLEEAVAQGLKKPELYLKLVDTSSLELDGDKVKGTAAAIKALKEADPSLFGTPDVKTQNTKTSTAPAGGTAFDPTKDFTKAEIQKLTPEQHKAVGEAKGWGKKSSPKGIW